MTQNKEENHLIEERRKKLAELRILNKAYPNDFKRKNLAGEIKKDLIIVKSGQTKHLIYGLLRKPMSFFLNNTQ